MGGDGGVGHGEGILGFGAGRKTFCREFVATSLPFEPRPTLV